MDNTKSFFMGGLRLKPQPKIVSKNDNSKSANRQTKSLEAHSKHKNSNTLNNSLMKNSNQHNSILNGNSLNQNLHVNNKNQNQQPPIKNKAQFLKHTENLLKQQRPITQQQQQRSVSLLQKTPVKMQSLLQKRSILNTMNSNLIANQYNSSNLLINSLMKTTINSSTNNLLSYPQDKLIATASASSTHFATATASSTSSLASPSPSSDRVDDKMIKVIKLCVTKLEFSSPLFRRIATKMNFLFIKPTYEHVRSNERFCSTSNKAVLKQVMNKGHTLKYKPSRGRSRMLRSNEIVDGKVMISWQRGAFTHVYTFNKRQRLRRYRQISLDLGFEHRTLQIMYGLKKVTLPRIIDCPYCSKKLTPDLGHYCVVARKTTSTKRLRSSSSKSLLLRRTTHQIKLKDNIQTSDYVSNESDNSCEFGLNQFSANSSRDKRSLLEDSSKINLHKLSTFDNKQPKRCPTLLLDSSNYKANQNSISNNVIVRRMDNRELSKKINSIQKQPTESSIDRLQIKKVDSLAAAAKNHSLIKCRVMDYDNFTVSSLENNIKIVFK